VLLRQRRAFSFLPADFTTPLTHFQWLAKKSPKEVSTRGIQVQNRLFCDITYVEIKLFRGPQNDPAALRSIASCWRRQI